MCPVIDHLEGHSQVIQFSGSCNATLHEGPCAPTFSCPTITAHLMQGRGSPLFSMQPAGHWEADTCCSPAPFTDRY